MTSIVTSWTNFWANFVSSNILNFFPQDIWYFIGMYLLEMDIIVYKNWSEWENEENLERQSLQKKYDLPWHRLALENEKITKITAHPLLLIKFENSLKPEKSRKRKDRYRPCTWLANTRQIGQSCNLVHSNHEIPTRSSYCDKWTSSFRNIGVLGFNEHLEAVGDGAICIPNQKTFRNTNFQVTFSETELNELKLSLYFLNQFANVDKKRRRKKD